MHNLRAKLSEKGWEQKHIEEAIRIFEEASQNSSHVYIFDRAAFWFSLLLAIGGNFIVSLALIPILLFLNGWMLYLVIVILGTSFGLLFEILIRTMEHLRKRHHALLSFLIPTLALVTFISISIFSNQLQAAVQLQNPHNPIVIACMYSTSFMMPYLVYTLLFKEKPINSWAK